MSRICSPGGRPPEFRWAMIEKMNKGPRGKICRAANAYTGGLIAVKTVRRDKLRRSTNSLLQLEKNLDFIKDHLHEHVIGIIKSTGWHEETIEVVMELKAGNLDSLVNSWRTSEVDPSDIGDLGMRAMHHALLGLQWLHSLPLLHGSIAPHNILYAQKGDDARSIHSFNFVFADFGLSTADPKAEHNRIYLAPERYGPDRHNSDKQVGCKSDIWSLYVTMLIVLQVDDFDLEIRTYDIEAHFSVITDIARKTKGHLKNLHVMARENEEDRWSADKLLNHFYRLGYFINRPLPPPDHLRGERRRYCPNAYVPPKKVTLTRQSTLERFKNTGDNLLRRITGDISDAVAGKRMAMKQYY